MSQCPECNVQLTIPIYLSLVGTIILVFVGIAGTLLTTYLFPFLQDYDPTGKVIRNYKVAAVLLTWLLFGAYVSDLFYKLVGKVVVRKPRFWES